jgi:ribosomal-protein-alanine N-acetyltransferase
MDSRTERKQSRLQADTSRVARPVHDADLPAIRAIFDQASLKLSPTPSTADASDLSRSLFVCESQGELVASIHWRSIVPEAEILDLAVKSEHRRRGHAAFLLQAFLQHAATLGIQKIFLEVRGSNAAALALYEKFGFKITGRRPNYYRDPTDAALLLQLLLSG